MKHHALILIGLVALPLCGCYQLAPPPQPPPPSGPTRTTLVCDQARALNPVPFVVQSYDPTTNTIPTADSDHPVNQNLVFEKDLAAAVAAATAVPGLQDQLCDLAGIFLDPRNCQDPGHGNPYDPTTCKLGGKEIADNSWGIRTYLQNPKGKKYIGISLGLWNNGCQAPTPTVCAPTFESFKTLHILALLDRTAEKGSNPHNNWSKNSPPSHSVSPSSVAMSPAIAVLAVLAHEYGHALWFDKFVVDANGNPDPGGHFSNQFFCSGNFYPGGLWGGALVDVPRDANNNRWLGFGDISPNANGDVRGLPDQIDSGGYPGIADALHRIHSSRQWATLLAAYSPDEDFVETFELSVLRDIGLQILKFKIHGKPDVVVFPPTAGSSLAMKLSCFP
jgi:hypothetical protein